MQDGSLATWEPWFFSNLSESDSSPSLETQVMQVTSHAGHAVTSQLQVVAQRLLHP